MAETSYYIISNIVELYILFRYYHAFFGKLTAPRWCIILLSLFLFCGSFSINLMQSVNLNLLASVLVTAGIGALYTGKWTKKAIYSAAFLTILIAMDIALFQVFTLLGHDMRYNFYTHGMISLILRAITMHMISLNRKPSEWQINPKILTIVAIIWAIILLYSFLFTPNISLEGEPSVRFVFLDTMLLLLSLLVFWIFELAANQQNTEKQAQEVSLQLEAQKKYYEQFETYEKEIRSYKHDMKNYLLGLLAIDETQRLIQIRNRIDQIDRTKKPDTENEVIQLLLSAKLEKLSIPKENLKIVCKIPKQIAIDSIDLSILLGNILDNIVEALEALPFEQRKLHIKMQYNSLRVTMEFCNPFLKKKTVRSSKNRGLGQKSIQKIIEKYHGEYKVIDEDNLYHTEITLLLIQRNHIE